MNRTTSAAGGRALRREESRGSLEDLIGPPQLPHLGTELAQLSGLLAGHARPRPAVDRGLADALAQRLGRSDPELGRDRLDRRPVRRVLQPDLGHHEHSALMQLRQIAPHTSHGSIFLSQDGASGNSGAIH